MAFSFKNSKDKTYYLHERKVTLKGGREQTIYFFGSEAKDGAIDKVPAGYEVSETSTTGLPVLKKSGGPAKAAPAKAAAKPAAKAPATAAAKPAAKAAAKPATKAKK